MFLKKIKDWLTNNRDITVDDARDNYKKYENMLRTVQHAYIQELRCQIKTSARKGKQSITTADTCYDFFTYEFMEEVKEYFEQRGFSVTKEGTWMKSWLVISWE